MRQQDAIRQIARDFPVVARCLPGPWAYANEPGIAAQRRCAPGAAPFPRLRLTRGQRRPTFSGSRWQRRQCSQPS